MTILEGSTHGHQILYRFYRSFKQVRPMAIEKCNPIIQHITLYMAWWGLHVFTTFLALCHLYYYSSGFNKVTLQSTHWSIQTLLISGGDSSCSWVFYSCTGPKCGVGVDLVDCNAVGGGHVTTSIDQSVRISACGALALEEYKQAASVQPLLCNS